MGLSRRKLLQGGVALGVSCAAPVRWVGMAVAAPLKGAVAPSWLNRSSFVALVNTPFRVTTGSNRSASLTLTAIGDLTRQPGQQGVLDSEGRFSLVFTSAATVAQGTYPVHHDVLGDSTFFIVPVGPKAAPLRYEVIVNRLK
jgi:hypothetical protein